MANTLGRGYPARKKREEVEKKRRKQRRTQNEREGATEVNRERKKTAPARGLIQGIVKQLHPNKPRGRPAKLTCLANPATNVHPKTFNIFLCYAAAVHHYVTRLFKRIKGSLGRFHIAQIILENSPISSDD